MCLVCEVAAQAAEIDNLAVVPEQSVDRGKIETVDNVESRAKSRRAGCLAMVVNSYDESVRIAAVGGKFLDVALFPNHRLFLLNLLLSLSGLVRWARGIRLR